LDSAGEEGKKTGKRKVRGAVPAVGVAFLREDTKGRNYSNRKKLVGKTEKQRDISIENRLKNIGTRNPALFIRVQESKKNIRDLGVVEKRRGRKDFEVGKCRVWRASGQQKKKKKPLSGSLEEKTSRKKKGLRKPDSTN